MSTPEERFRLACNELGWGDAKDGLWFVSIEEGSAWKSENEVQIEEHYGRGKLFRDDSVAADSAPEANESGGRSQIKVVEAKIAAPCSRSKTSWQAFQKTIWKNGSKVAHANLYPLGKPRLGSLPAHYSQLFGYGNAPTDLSRYQAAVKSARFPRLRTARDELHPQAIVCLGKTFWRDFRVAFALSGVGTPIDSGRVEVYEKERIILAPHFAYGHISDVRAELIAGVLERWGVSIP